MPTLSQAKTLGGIGAILGLLILVPYAGAVLAIVGLVLTLIAVKYISDVVGDKSIFSNMIISVILNIIGVVVAIVVVIGVFFSFMGMGYLGSGFTGTFSPSAIPSGNLMSLVGTVLLGLVVVWVFYLVSAVFLKRSYDSVAKKLGVNMFHTAALLYLIGAALAIILVGFVLIFVALILEVVAFFSIPDQLPQQQPPATAMQPPPPPPPPAAPPPAQVAGPSRAAT